MCNCYIAVGRCTQSIKRKKEGAKCARATYWCSALMLGAGHSPLQSPATITLQTGAFAPYFALRHQQQEHRLTYTLGLGWRWLWLCVRIIHLCDSAPGPERVLVRCATTPLCPRHLYYAHLPIHHTSSYVPKTCTISLYGIPLTSRYIRLWIQLFIKVTHLFGLYPVTGILNVEWQYTQGLRMMQWMHIVTHIIHILPFRQNVIAFLAALRQPPTGGKSIPLPTNIPISLPPLTSSHLAYATQLCTHPEFKSL